MSRPSKHNFVAIAWLSSGLITLACAAGCAGPTTPLGAIWSLSPVIPVAPKNLASPQASRVPSSRTALQPNIRFDPPRQVLHGSHPLKVVIDDSSGMRPDYDLRVTYHGHDVTHAFLAQARISREARRLVLEVPTVRLSPMQEHLIEVTYRNPASARVSSRYLPPICRAFDRASLKGPSPDPVPAPLRGAAQQLGFNPAFMAALIAQESALDSNGVSQVRALGDRWQDSDLFSKISWTGDAEVARTRLILASYNSGYARVAQAIERDGAAWLMSPELREARRYVNRILSYCDALQNGDPGQQGQQLETGA